MFKKKKLFLLVAFDTSHNVIFEVHFTLAAIFGALYALKICSILLETGFTTITNTSRVSLLFSFRAHLAFLANGFICVIRIP